jgi:hypothetical protein
MKSKPSLKYALSFVLIITLHSAFGQIFSVIETTKKEGEWKFPVIKSQERSAVANKINFAIQSGSGGDPGTEDPFMMVPEEDQYGYKVAALNDRVVSVMVWGAHSGAGYHLTETYYNFDSKTGAQIQLNKMFGNERQAGLRKALCELWKMSLETNSHGTSQPEEYQRCLNESKNRTQCDILNWQITDHGIQLWTDLCLDGSNYANDAAKGPHELSFEQFAPFLTPYGYSLFITKPSKGPFSLLMHGTIATYPINLILLPDADKPGSVNGRIVYERVGEPLNLIGTVNGNKFSLHEVDASNKPFSDIEVTWDGTKLTGTFLNLKTQKQLPFMASGI